MENKTFSHYTIIRKLGAGGMASVYLADDNELPRQVALKLLPHQYIADKQLTERFFREARAAAKLEHPNIILIYEASVFQGQPFIAMQYIDGPTVADLINAKGKIEIEEAVSIICKVLETLEAAHHKGIFHRDIKPTNIMLKDGKYVRVIDFGIAKAQTDSNLTAAGTAFGTPAYMAPEQFSAMPDSNSALFDIYAVGVTFYYMLCGKLPFEGDNPYTIRDAKIYKRPPNPSAMSSNIPPALDDVIMKAMASDPKNRYQSAKEMFEAIHNSLKASQTAIIDFKEDPAVRTEIPSSKKGMPKWPLAVAAGLVLLVGGYFAYHKISHHEVDANGPDSSKVTPVKAQPAAPILLSPLDGSTITSTDKPDFVWSRTVGDGIKYSLEYSNKQDLAQAIRIGDIKDTVYSPKDGLANDTYYWRVQAIDNEGSISEIKGLQASFKLDYGSPPVPAEQGIISIRVNEPSSIFIDGKLVKANASSWEGKVEAGKRKVRVENQGSDEKALEETVTVKAGERFTKDFTFTIPTVETELIVVSPPYPAQIYVDGVLSPDRTPTTITLSAGDHNIRVKRVDNGQEMQEKISVEKDRKKTLRFDFDNKKTMIQ